MARPGPTAKLSFHDSYNKEHDAASHVDLDSDFEVLQNESDGKADDLYDQPDSIPQREL